MARQSVPPHKRSTTHKAVKKKELLRKNPSKSKILGILFFLIIFFSPLSLTLPSSAQLPPQSLILTEMDVSLNVHVNLTAVQISFTLIPTSAQDNSFDFVIRGRVNDTKIKVRDGDSLLFNETYNQTHTLFTIYFPKSLLSPGTSLYVDMSYVVNTILANEHQVVNFSIKPESAPTTSRVIAWIDASLSITLLNPQPLNQEVMGKTTRITWIFFQEKEVSVYIDTLFNPNNKFTTIAISPQTILIKGVSGTEVSFHVNLTSTYPLPQIVSIIASENNTKIDSPITLEPYQSMIITIKVNIPFKETTKQIIFLSKIPNSQPIILTMLLIPEPTSNSLFSPAQIFTVIIIILVTFIIAFIMFRPPVFVKKSYNKIVSHKPFSKLLKPVPLTPPQPDQAVIEKTREPSIDMNKVALTLAKTNYFDKNEKMLLAYLMENKGISQQKIADALSLSKATVSRTISKLQAKQLVIKEQSGMTNKIFLNEEKFYSTLENISKNMEETTEQS